MLRLQGCNSQAQSQASALVHNRYAEEASGWGGIHTTQITATSQESKPAADVLPRRVGAGYLAAWVAPVSPVALLPPVALPLARLSPATDALARGRRLLDPVSALAPLPDPMAHHPPVPMAHRLAPAIRAACLRPAAARARIATTRIAHRPPAVHPLAVHRRVARW